LILKFVTLTERLLCTEGASRNKHTNLSVQKKVMKRKEVTVTLLPVSFLSVPPHVPLISDHSRGEVMRHDHTHKTRPVITDALCLVSRCHCGKAVSHLSSHA
jgi:hypothetical protein